MTQAIEPGALPAVIRGYLDARANGSTETAMNSFAEDGFVADDGNEYRGRTEIGAWIASSSSEYEYTTTFLSAEHDGEGVTVINRLDGTFPGGTVELRFRFVLDDGGAIRELTIAP